MASDPTDLIREGRAYADALALQQGKFEAADIVNRILDALEGSRREVRDLVAEGIRQKGTANAARADLAEVLTAITGETEQALLVHSGWIVVEAGGCTCYGGGPYGHEPGCGLEPIMKLADVGRTEAALAEANATISRITALAREYGEWSPLLEERIRRAIQGPAT